MKKFFFVAIETPGKDLEKSKNRYSTPLCIVYAKDEEKAARKAEKFKNRLDDVEHGVAVCYGVFNGRMPSKYRDCEPDYLYAGKNIGWSEYDDDKFDSFRKSEGSGIREEFRPVRNYFYSCYYDDGEDMEPEPLVFSPEPDRSSRNRTTQEIYFGPDGDEHENCAPGIPDPDRPSRNTKYDQEFSLGPDGDEYEDFSPGMYFGDW